MFLIWYEDGTVFEGGEDSLRDAPHRGVQVVGYNDTSRNQRNIGRYLLRGWDLYIYTTEVGWVGTDKYADLVDHIQNHTVITVLTGRWIETGLFRSILSAAETDPRLQPKSAIEKIETP